MKSPKKKPILEAEKLHTWFPVPKGILGRVHHYVKAVQNVSLQIQQGEIYSLVGESGCGKSTLGRTLLGLEKRHSGIIRVDGQEILANDAKYWAPYRRDLQMIFQNPNTTLNPRKTILESLSAPLKAHNIIPVGERTDRVAHFLEKVGLPVDYMHRFPHSFSGGQKQRIGIARALLVEPRLIVCDEVTSALDVSVQAQILHLLRDLQRELGFSLIFISHDLSVVRSISDRVGVMYWGHLVEEGDAHSVLDTPRHPYTQALRAAIPTLNAMEAPQLLEGEVPQAGEQLAGCPFYTRCTQAQEHCVQEFPPLRKYKQNTVYCHLENT